MGKAIKLDQTLLMKKLSKPEDFNVGQFSKVVAEDSGAMIKVTGLQDFKDIMMDKSNKGKNKWDKSTVKLGLSKGNLVITGEAANGEKDNVVVCKKYADLKKRKDVVINAQKGDKTIDSSTKSMAKAKGVPETDLKGAKLSKVTGNVIILAHGGSSGSSPGKVYCNGFGKKSAKDIVKYLIKAKPLPKDYSGIVYLDGCFTAAGSSGGTDMKDLNNFAGKVYAGLKKAGYKNLQVKGNLGTAKTNRDGSESVVDAQAEAKLKKLLEKELKPFKKKIDKAQKIAQATQDKMTAFKKARMKLKTSLKGAEGKKLETLKKTEVKLEAVIKEYEEKAEKLWKLVAVHQKEYDKQLKKAFKKHGATDKEFKDLVGTFGPEELRV